MSPAVNQRVNSFFVVSVHRPAFTIVAWTPFWLGNSAWDFGFGFLPPFDHPCQLKSGVPQPPPPLGPELVGGFWNGNIYDESRLLWTEKMDDLLSCNMWIYARVILACTGVKDYNTPRDWLPKGKSAIKVLKQMINVQRSTQLTKGTHETPQNSSSVFVSVLKQARNSDAYTARQLLRQNKT